MTTGEQVVTTPQTGVFYENCELNANTIYHPIALNSVSETVVEMSLERQINGSVVFLTIICGLNYYSVCLLDAIFYAINVCDISIRDVAHRFKN